MKGVSREDILYCKSINKARGKNYYYASYFYPRDIREKIFILYAFVRVSDDFVDGAIRDPEEQKRRLTEWTERWTEAYEKGASDDRVLNATAKLFHECAIPFDLSIDFLNAMLSDTNVSRYETYEVVELYMYGSAAVIGRMIIYIVGYNDERAFNHGDSLSYAMQFTNFLRDIREDYDSLGRVYMPHVDLERFGLTEDDLGKRVLDERFLSFMKFQIERARALYAHAYDGIRFLKRGRLAIRLGGYVYEGILDDIERNGYDIYSKRRGSSTIKKLMYLIKALYAK